MNDQTAQHSFWREANRLFRFGLPLVIGQAAAVGIGLTDVFMAGQASANDLAGVTLGNSLTIFVFLILGGILFANGPMLGFHFGANDREAVRNQFHQCMWLALPLGIIATLLMIFGIWLVGQLGAEPVVVDIARHYLYPMLATVFMYHLMFWKRTTLEAVNVPQAVMVVNILGLLLNFVLDYALVFGHFGLPKLGGAGCGWATLIVVTLQTLSFFLWLKYGRTPRKFNLFSEWYRPKWEDIKAILKVGLPIATTIMFEFSYFGVIPLIVAKLGSEVVSAHSIAQQIDAFMFIAPLGIAQAITIAVSHNIGGKRYAMAQLSCKVGLILIAAIALVQMAVYLIFPQALAELFSDNRSVQVITIELMAFAAAFRLMDALAVGAMGALRGYKITRSPMYIQFAAFWVVGFPLAYSLAMTSFWGEPMGVAGFWLGAVVALSASALMLNIMVWQHQKRPVDPLQIQGQ